MATKYSQSPYTKQVLKHSQHPMNYGMLKNASGTATSIDQVCFDQTTISVKISKDGKKIQDIKFITGGCPASVASSSVLSVMAKGKPVEKALKITQKDIMKELKALPDYKLHCANLPIRALKEAVEDYRKKTKAAKTK